MKWFLLWLKIICKQATRQMSALIYLAISLALLVLVVQFVTDLGIAKRILREHTYGSQHAFLFKCTDDMIKTLYQDTRVASTGLINQLGYATNPKSDLSDTVGVGSFDEQARQSSFLELEEGRWPQSESEVVIEAIALLKLRLIAKIGDPVELSLMQPSIDESNTPVVHSKVYTLVGILKNYSYMQYHPDASEIDKLRLPGIVTTISSKANAVPLAKIAAIRLMGGVSYFSFFKEIADRFNLTIDQYYLNTAVYPPDAPLELVGSRLQNNLSSYFPAANNEVGYNDQSKVFEQMLNLVVALLISLLVFSIVSTLLVLRKKFEKSVQNLRLAGISTIQIVLATSSQTALYLLIIIPIGLIVGLSAIFLSSAMIIRDKIPYFSSVIHFDLIVLIILAYSFLLTLSSALLMYLAIRHRPLAGNEREFVPDTKRIVPDRTFVQTKLSHHRSQRLERRPILLWAGRSFRENQMAMSAILFTLALCFSAILVSGLLLASLQQTNTYYSKYDAEISNSRAGFKSSLYIPLIQSSFAAGDLTKLSTINEIRQIYMSNNFLVNVIGTHQPESIQLMESLGFIDTESNEKNDPEVTAVEKAQFGYLPEERIFTGSLTGVDQGMLELIKPYVIEGEIDIVSLMSGESVILLSRSPTLSVHAGTSLTLTQIIDPDPTTDPSTSEKSYSVDTSDWIRKDVPVKICAVVYLDKRVSGLPISPGRIIWGIRAFSQFGIVDRITGVSINLKRSDDDDALRAEISRLSALYPQTNVIVRSVFEQQVQNTRRIILFIAYGLLLLLISFALFSLYSFSKSLTDRNRRVIGALRASGFSYDRMKRLKLLESAWMVFLAFCFANMMTIGIIAALVSAQYPQSVFSQLIGILQGYPLLPAAICMPAMVLAAYYFSLLPVRRLYRLPVCELLSDL